MNRYSPLWSGIVDSSIWLEPDYVCKIFVTMLAKKDLDHVVRGTAFNIGQWSKKSEAEVIEALKILSSPDKRRIEPQPFEGRRIERVEDGWLILNGKTYVEAMKKANRNAYQAKKQKEYRAARPKPGTPLAGEGAYVKASERGDQAECDRLAAGAAGVPAGVKPAAVGGNGVESAEAVAARVRLAVSGSGGEE